MRTAATAALPLLAAAGEDVVLLGATGFLGAALRHRLAQVPGCRVRALGSADLDLTAPGAAERLTEAAGPGATLVVTARARGPDPIGALTGDVAIAAVVARCVAAGRLARCVYFSSTAVYGDGVSNLAITEDTPLAPNSPYGAAKVAAEGVLRHAAQKGGVPLLVLRPCMVYGPGDRSSAYGPPGFVRAALRGGPVRLYGDGSELRDYVCIADAAAAAAALALGGQTGVLNLASGASHSFQEVVALLRRLVPGRFEVVTVPRDRPKTDQCFDTARLTAAVPGFRFTPLAEGLRAASAAPLAA